MIHICFFSYFYYYETYIPKKWIPFKMLDNYERPLGKKQTMQICIGLIETKNLCQSFMNLIYRMPGFLPSPEDDVEQQQPQELQQQQQQQQQQHYQSDEDEVGPEHEFCNPL